MLRKMMFEGLNSERPQKRSLTPKGNRGKVGFMFFVRSTREDEAGDL